MSVALSSPEVVVLGTGAIGAQGLNVPEMWRAFSSRKPSTRQITNFNLPPDFPFKFAGQVPLSDDELRTRLTKCADVLLPKAPKSPKRQNMFAVIAAHEAAHDAFFDIVTGQSLPRPETERIGTIIGATMGGPILSGAPAGRTVTGYQHCATAYLNKALGIQTDFSLSISGACASGLQAIITAAIALKADQADLMFAGGTDSQIAPAALEARSAILSRNNASRPFDQQADGIIMGEGAGVLVLSTLAHAKSSRYLPLAKLEGFSSLAGGEDTNRPDAPLVAKLVLQALSSASLGADGLNARNTAVFAHAPGNQAGDIPEVEGLQSIFGLDVRNIPIVSLASWIGHPLGPAGALRSVLAVEALNQRWIFGNLNLRTPHSAFQSINFPGPEGLRMPGLRHIIVLSLGLGGNYACAIFGRYQ